MSVWVGEGLGTPPAPPAEEALTAEHRGLISPPPPPPISTSLLTSLLPAHLPYLTLPLPPSLYSLLFHTHWPNFSPCSPVSLKLFSHFIISIFLSPCTLLSIFIFLTAKIFFFFFMPSNFFEPRLQLYVCLNSDGVLSGQIVVPVFVCQTNNYCVISRTLPFSDDPEQSVFACCRWRFSSAARETRPCVHLFMPAHREGSPCIFMNNRHILWIRCEASLCLMAPSHSSLVYRFAWHVIYLHRHPDGDVTWYFSSLRVLISELLTYYWNRKCMTFWPLNSSKTILSAQMRKKNTCTITAIREYIYI